MDLFPIGLSLRVSFLATLLAIAVGTPLAWLLARRRFPGRDLLEACVVLPMILPPTVLGYYLLVLLGSGGPIGRVLDAMGIPLVFTWKAAVVAACVGSIPLLIKAAQAGFESVDPTLEHAARTLGRSEWSIFWSITAPLAWRSFLAGGILTYCRAFGDFGITLMVTGSIPGKTQTIPLAIYDNVQANQLGEANGLALIAIGVVLILLLGIGRLARVRF